VTKRDSKLPRVVALEIQLDRTGLSDQEIDERTRRLVEQLRELPHRSVGIVSKQISEAADEPMGATTEGRIAMSVSAEILPEVVKALHKNRGLILKGPNEAILNFIGSVPRDQIDVWLNAVLKNTGAHGGAQCESAAGLESAALPSSQELRAHARRHIESGAITQEYLADREQVLTVLNQVLATEIVCILRYKSHYYQASGIQSHSVRVEFLEHAQEAQQHADQVATRIVQLNGAPNFNPEGLTSRSRSEFSTGATLIEMIKEDLIAERIAVEFYSAIIRWLGESDLTTRKVMQDILAVEARHAEDMKVLLESLQTT
jgi:bacterioferritin